MKRKVGIIGTNGLPARYGGFETLADYLAKYLQNEYDLIVYCSNLNKGNKQKYYNEVRLVHFPFSANGFQGIIYDIISIFHAFFSADTLLILGSSGTIVLPFKNIFKKKVIFNFGGLDWQREKWSFAARWFLKKSEGFGVKYSDHIVVDNSVFEEYVKEKYNKKSELIEYGGDHVKDCHTKEILKKYCLNDNDYFLSVSRAQEDNYIHLLLSAFEIPREKKLVVISNWNTSSYGRKLKEEFSNHENIILIDAIYNQEELDCIRKNAFWYIHTHTACGSAPSLIEAMSLELPIISIDVPANRATTENKAIYFNNVKELVKILENLSEYDKSYNAQLMGEIASRRYKWNIISKKYSKLF